MKTKILLFAAAIIVTATAAAKWSVVTSTDPMTDAVSYLIGTDGDEYAVSEYTKATPSLVIRISPESCDPKTGRIVADQDVMITFKPDAIRRDGTTALVRFDKSKAEPWTCSASTSRQAAFVERAPAFIARLKKSREIYIRFETTLGAIRTLRFDTADLTSAIEDVKTRIRNPAQKRHPNDTL